MEDCHSALQTSFPQLPDRETDQSTTEDRHSNGNRVIHSVVDKNVQNFFSPFAMAQSVENLVGQFPCFLWITRFADEKEP